MGLVSLQLNLASEFNLLTLPVNIGSSMGQIDSYLFLDNQWLSLFSDKAVLIKLVLNLK